MAVRLIDVLLFDGGWVSNVFYVHAFRIQDDFDAKWPYASKNPRHRYAFVRRRIFAFYFRHIAHGDW